MFLLGGEKMTKYIMKKAGNIQQGFTMIELIVVMVLITVMVTIFLANFRGVNKTKSLDLAAEKLVSDLKEIQGNALNAKEYSGAIPCGWGIHYIDDDTYIYYAGGNEGGTCEMVADRDFDGSDDILVQSVDLQNSGEIEFSGAFSDIFFESPNPDTYIGNDKSSGLVTVITLQLKTDATVQRIITITTAGKILLN